MRIHEIIKEKRKEQEMTQEQMAQYLGVSAPAVNKWEKGTTYPDITVLPALARLLKVDLNTLLSFHEELTETEIGMFTNELAVKASTEGFQAAYELGIAKIQEYPTCGMLINNVAAVLDGILIFSDISDKTEYEVALEQLYVRAAKSTDANVKNQAIMMLVYKYMGHGDYDKAQSLINTYPDTMLDKKQMQGNLYLRQGKLNEAAVAYEGKILSMIADIQASLLHLQEIAIQEHEMNRAQEITKVTEQVLRLLDAWDYNCYVPGFQLACAKQDGKECITWIEKLLDAMQKPWEYTKSSLYCHLTPKNQQNQGFEMMKKGMLEEIEQNDKYSFIRKQPEYANLVAKYKK